MNQPPSLLAAAKEALGVLCTIEGTNEVMVVRHHLRDAIKDTEMKIVRAAIKEAEESHGKSTDPQ